MADEVELYRRFRPALFKHVLGQSEAVGMLEKMVKENKVPHALLFSGPSGVGKTTLARILKSKLNCSDHDFCEINAADTRGIETTRSINRRKGLSPMKGICKIWYFDEVHKLTGDAQTSILKLLEDTPSHVYFILATTDPNKLLKTILTRCTEIKLQLLSAKVLQQLISHVLEQEKKKLTEDVIERLVEVAEGSARKALVLLHQIIDLDNEEEQLNAIQKSDSKRQAIELARMLLNPKEQWVKVAALLKELEDDPESLRRIILGYASSVLLGGGKLAPRCFQLICAFESNTFDSGKPGLVRACYEVMQSK